ncbi:PKD domain-containing protein [Microscilla marina]|uniref:Immunoreactive 92 kDa antigen PG21, putative n=1 Tax=Microscilla marina ATCC 23134 TaxID=313606 RepID=A1ZXK0_MICM2|nr:PKD domain-containing protein [Microscilla marina]EAY24875.1 immunoreactive 92 kDa antigen PG21, putative [Microscilla marina ATCC 23134]
MQNITLNKILLTFAIFVSSLQLTTAQQQVTNALVTTYPYTESFEESTNDWTLNVGGNDFNWARSQSGTATKATEGQYYMYIDAGSSSNLNKKAAFQSRTFDLTSLNKPSLVFAFHLLGGATSIGTLEVEASTDGTSWTKVWSTDGNTTTGSGWTAPMPGHDNSWKEAVVNLSAHKSANTQLRFVGSATNIWANYIAIDAITITEDGAPAITGVTPSGGFLHSPVTINGVGLTGNGSSLIEFNGAAFSFSTAQGPYIDYTYINFSILVPEGATTGKVTVTVDGQTATSMTDFQVPSVVTTFPYNESFEAGDAGSWKRNGSDPWYRREGWHGEPYWSTKPHKPSKGYSYITLMGNKGKKGSLISPPVDARKLKNPTITFDYHMGIYLYYTDSSSPSILTLEVSKDGGATWTQVWRKEHTHQEGNPNGWTTASVSLKGHSYAQMLLRFSGTRSNSWNNDISIDNVTIEEVPVLGQPVADFKVSSTEIWEGESLKFNNESQNATSYLWKFSRGYSDQTSVEEHLTVKYDIPGSFHVILIAYNELGQSTAKTMAVTVKARPKLPVADFKVSSTEIWEGESLKFNNESQNATSYVWRFTAGYSDRTSMEEHLTVKYDSPGTFYVRLIAYNEFGQSTANRMTITVKARPKLPVANFKVSTTEIWEGESLKFNNESQNASRYEWRFEGGDIFTSTDTHPIVKYDTPGFHLVKLIAYNDQNQTAVKYMRISVLKRATARTTSNTTTTIATVDVKVYSKTGALLKTTKIAENAPPAKSLKGLQNGLYFVHVATKTGVQKYQIMK